MILRVRSQHKINVSERPTRKTPRSKTPTLRFAQGRQLPGGIRRPPDQPGIIRLPVTLDAFHPNHIQEELARQSRLSHSSEEECKKDPAWLFNLKWCFFTSRGHESKTMSLEKWIRPKDWEIQPTWVLDQIQEQLEGKHFQWDDDRSTTVTVLLLGKNRLRITQVPFFCKDICPVRLAEHIRYLRNPR